MGKRQKLVGDSGFFSGARWHPEFADEHRRRLEAAYGLEFSDDSWEQLNRHILFYAAAAADEYEAPSVSELVASLGKVEAAAWALIEALAGGGAQMSGTMQSEIEERWERILRRKQGHNERWELMRQDIEAELRKLGHPDATERSWRIIGSWRERQYFPEPSIVDDVRDGIYGLATGVKKCLSDFAEKKAETRQAGDSWRKFIKGLARWAASNRYPITISKGADKSNDGDQASDFARFVWALQKEMPSQYRRHTQSLNALSTGLHRAVSAPAD